MFKNNEKLISQKNQKNFRNIKILCIGDLILDRYIFGKIERNSPEAPVPILLYNKEKYGLGGVGNVAKNIISLGAKVKLIALYGNDLASNEVSNLLKKTKEKIFSSTTRQTQIDAAERAKKLHSFAKIYTKK